MKTCPLFLQLLKSKLLDPNPPVHTFSLSIDQPNKAVLYQFCYPDLTADSILNGLFIFCCCCRRQAPLIASRGVQAPPSVRSVSTYLDRRVVRLSVEVGPNRNVNSASLFRSPESSLQLSQKILIFEDYCSSMSVIMVTQPVYLQLMFCIVPHKIKCDEVIQLLDRPTDRPKAVDMLLQSVHNQLLRVSACSKLLVIIY